MEASDRTPPAEAPRTTTPDSLYAIFRVVDHEGAKAWLPVGVDDDGGPKGYSGKTRKQALTAAIRAGDAELGGGPYYGVPITKIGETLDPKAPDEPPIRW